MAKTQGTPTKTLFECLLTLYKQGQLLLLDADRLMGEKGWEPMHNAGNAALSNSINSPQRWFARWAMRFYMPAVSDREQNVIDQILFVSIHFTSDHDTEVDEPLVSAGRLVYREPMNYKVANNTYDYWMCKYWFYGEPHDKLSGWHKTGQSRWYENLKGTETFIIPLYEITSSEKLKQRIIDPLLAVCTEVEKVT